MTSFKDGFRICYWTSFAVDVSLFIKQKFSHKLLCKTRLSMQGQTFFAVQIARLCSKGCRVFVLKLLPVLQTERRARIKQIARLCSKGCRVFVLKLLPVLQTERRARIKQIARLCSKGCRVFVLKLLPVLQTERRARIKLILICLLESKHFSPARICFVFSYWSDAVFFIFFCFFFVFVLFYRISGFGTAKGYKLKK